MEQELQKKANKLFSRFGEKYGYTPVFGDPNLGEAFDDVELIDYFEYGIRLWIMKPLEKLFALQVADHDPDYGFAMMIIINSIPEFIGKIQGHPETKQINEGVKYIFGDNVDDYVIDCLRKKLRNAIAHNLFTQEHIVLNGHGVTPVQAKPDETAIIINPVVLALQFVNALGRFVNELRAELEENQVAETTWFAEFKKYMTGNKLKYFSVKLNGKSYGYRERIRSYTDITEQIRKLSRFQGMDFTVEKPDVIVENPDQLLELCRQLVRGK